MSGSGGGGREKKSLHNGPGFELRLGTKEEKAIKVRTIKFSYGCSHTETTALVITFAH